MAKFYFFIRSINMYITRGEIGKYGISENLYSDRFNRNNVSFEGLNSKRISEVFTLPANKLKTYSVDDYNKLTKLDKKILRFEYKCSTLGFRRNFCKNIENMHDGITDFMKDSLDQKYGEGQYVVLTIGRSLSSIGKVLGYKIGEDNVINIPLSGAHKFVNNKIISETSEKEIEGFEKYLTSVGVTKDKVKASGKKYIITDFCFSGASLRGANMLFKSSRLLGDLPNIYIENIDSLMPATSKANNFKDAFRCFLYESKLKRYAFVNKNLNLKNTSDSVVNPQKANKSVKLMWFKLLDNFMCGKKATLEELNSIKVNYPFLD